MFVLEGKTRHLDIPSMSILHLDKDVMAILYLDMNFGLKSCQQSMCLRWTCSMLVDTLLLVLQDLHSGKQ